MHDAQLHMHAHINAHLKAVEVTSLTHHGVVFSFYLGTVKTSFQPYITYCLDRIVSVAVGRDAKIRALLESQRRSERERREDNRVD